MEQHIILAAVVPEEMIVLVAQLEDGAEEVVAEAEDLETIV
jgi:hypothetical protein